MRNVSLTSAIGAKLLKRINLKLYESEKITIVSDSDSDKEFLVSLMFLRNRIDEDDVGEFEMFGKRVDYTEKRHLRSQMMYLFHDPPLLSGKMRGNIDPRNEHSDDELIEVLHYLKLPTALSKASGLADAASVNLWLRRLRGSVELSRVELSRGFQRPVRSARLKPKRAAQDSLSASMLVDEAEPLKPGSLPEGIGRKSPAGLSLRKLTKKINSVMMFATRNSSKSTNESVDTDAQANDVSEKKLKEILGVSEEYSETEKLDQFFEEKVNDPKSLAWRMKKINEELLDFDSDFKVLLL